VSNNNGRRHQERNGGPMIATIVVPVARDLTWLGALVTDPEAWFGRVLRALVLVVLA